MSNFKRGDRVSWRNGRRTGVVIFEQHFQPAVYPDYVCVQFTDPSFSWLLSREQIAEIGLLNVTSRGYYVKRQELDLLNPDNIFRLVERYILEGQAPVIPDFRKMVEDHAKEI